jgi:tetratricopeptide (TPR) repeat protein
MDLGRVSEALATYERALTLKPDFVMARSNRAGALRRLGRLDEALESCNGALVIDPHFVGALSLRAQTLVDLGRFDEAIACIQALLAIHPDAVNWWMQCGALFEQLGRLDDAILSVERAIALQPTFARALTVRAVLTGKREHLNEALAMLERAIAINPLDTNAQFDAGRVLILLNRPDDALARLDQVLASGDPREELRAFSHDYRGFALKELKRLNEAGAAYEAALLVRDDPTIRWDEGLYRLLIGDLRAGWERCEARWQGSMKAEARGFDAPLWLGQEPLSGKTILLHAEQGLGDTLQFCRYVSMVAALGARIVLEVQAPLKPLLESLHGVGLVLSRGESLPRFDFHCPLMSLPLAFETTLETIPARVPYIQATPVKLTEWMDRAGPVGPKASRMRLGLAWSGNPKYRVDVKRSIESHLLEPLLTIDADWTSVQKELRDDHVPWLSAHPEIRHFGDDLSDFADTAALVQQMDLVISIDTSVAHLAGAMGKSVWILLPFVPDWRWMLDRNDNPWYPTARLFRQPKRGDWESVIEDVVTALRKHRVDVAG